MVDLLEQQIKKEIRELGGYNPQLKESIWSNLKDEIEFETCKEGNKKVKRKHSSRWLLVATIGMTLIGTTVLAQPIINHLKTYFGESKMQDVYDEESGEFIRSDATLYESPLGYLIYYNQEGFEIFTEGNQETFVAKHESGTSIEIIREEEDLEVTFKKLTGELLKKEERNQFKTPTYIEAQKEFIGKQLNQTIFLCDGQELGTFIIKISYKEKNTTWGRFCHSMIKEFVPLNRENSRRIEEGKPQLVFNYDQEKYELVQYRTEPHRIYLQKQGIDHPDYSTDILLTYCHEFNRSVEELIKEDIESHQKNRKIFEELNAELVAEGKKTPEEAARGITTLEEVESKLGENVRKLITLNDDGTLRYIDYYVDDGQGGCYQIMVYQPYNEDLEAVMLSTKIVIEQGNDTIMPYRVIVDESLG